MVHDPTQLIICDYCDSVYHRPALASHQQARCQRCDAILARHHFLSLDQLLALTVTAGMLLCFLLFYPVLLVQTRGQTHSATLIESVVALIQGPISIMAIVTAFAILVVPAMQIFLLLWILMYSRFSRRAPGFRYAMLTLTALRPWNMLEVFLLGAVIAIVKLTGRLEAMPAVGLFALGGLSLLLIGIAGRDLHLLWEKLP